MFQPQQAAELGSFGASSFRVKNRRKGLWNLPQRLRKASGARIASGVSQRGVPERPLWEAVKVTMWLPWRPQDVRDARAMEFLPKRAANRDWNQPKKKKCMQSIKLNRVGDLKRISTLDMEMQSSEFVQLVFSLALIKYFPIMVPSLGFEGDEYLVPLYVGST